MEDLLREAARLALRYRQEVLTDPIRPDPEADVSELGGELPEGPIDPMQVLKLMDEVGSPATMGFSSPRFFGWVIGGVQPVALAADWMVSAWDQPTYAAVASPATVAMEAAAIRWIKEASGLPETAWGVFVTGTTVAHMATLAAARSAVLSAEGWDATGQGLFGAPAINVVVGEEVHPSLIKALGVVGLGRDRVIEVPVDDQGRMRADAFPELSPPAIVCLQAGNVNTGAFDPMAEIIPRAKESGAWVHVDGAFGFWAAASPRLAHLTTGMELADSWATDAHKYLNVPYDAGVALVRSPSDLARLMSVDAAYLVEGEIGMDPGLYTPEMSRRARGVPTWAVLKSLGRSGLAELVDRTVRMAQRFAEGMERAGYNVLNDVVLNQVLVDLGDPETTRRIVSELQAEGTMFAGPTEWQGHTAMRISVSNFATTEDEIDQSIEAVLRVAGR
ncbi:MAG: pyridoxal phosphate-dependent decarboxylase family protein [Acidimicrobiia bacterium]